MQNVRRLEYLIAIANTGSFRKAAESVHVTQPTLSQQIMLLEAELEVTLIDRSLNYNALTPAGREVVKRATIILNDIKDLRRACRMEKEGHDLGILRLGASPTIGPYLMPEVLNNLHIDKPNLRIHIREGFPEEQLNLLVNGEIDLLLAPLALRQDGIHSESLFSESLQLVAPADHPLAAKKELSATDLFDIGLLNLDPRHQLFRKIASICESLKMRPLNDYEGTSLDSVFQMVASGLGFAVLPELYLTSSAGARGAVKILRIKDVHFTRDVILAWRKQAPFHDLGIFLANRIRVMAGLKLKASA